MTSYFEKQIPKSTQSAHIANEVSRNSLKVDFLFWVGNCALEKAVSALAGYGRMLNSKYLSVWTQFRIRT